MNSDAIPFRVILSTLVDLARNADVDVMLVGATARDMALVEEHQDAALRATNDVDIAVAVESTAAFERLTGGLEPISPNSVHKFVVDGIEVDIVPFGGIESAERTITWPDGVTMNTLGFVEAFESAFTVALGDGRDIRVASIAAQVALKLFAWVDRGQSTERDAVDLRTLVHVYSTRGRLDDVYAEENLETLAILDYEVRDAGAHKVGRDVRAQLGGKVGDRCIEIIDSEISDENRRLARAMRGDEIENLRVLGALRLGLAP